MDYTKSLYFLFDNIALETTGADFKGQGCTLYLSFYLYQIGPPGAAGMVLGMAYLVPGNGVFSANIAYT
jgi:hypothetical protein